MDLEILFKLVWTHITVCNSKAQDEDEAGHVLQPTLKHNYRKAANWISNGPLKMTGYLYRYESHSLSAMYCVTMNWNQLTGQATGIHYNDECYHGNEGHTGRNIWSGYVITVATLDGWPREHTLPCTMPYYTCTHFKSNFTILTNK